jgi:catechol 2,3-dioxygenase-like lactoylglutathione lyase family enzyme
MKIDFVTSIAVIAPDPARSRELYVDTIGLPLADDGGSGYFHSDQVAGTRHFGIWPLSQAAQACFGTDEWPESVPVPQVSIEFEVADPGALAAAAEELGAAGHELLHPPREEPWGQTVARLLSPEGAIVGISLAPAVH